MCISPILLRGRAEVTTEHPGEVVGILEPHLISNIGDPRVGHQQPPGRHHQAQILDKGTGGLAGVPLEQAAQGGGAQVGGPAQGLGGELLGRVVHDVVHQGADAGILLGQAVEVQIVAEVEGGVLPDGAAPRWLPPGLFHQPGDNQLQIAPDPEGLARVLGGGAAVHLVKIGEDGGVPGAVVDQSDMEMIPQQILCAQLGGGLEADGIELKGLVHGVAAQPAAVGKVHHLSLVDQEGPAVHHKFRAAPQDVAHHGVGQVAVRKDPPRPEDVAIHIEEVKSHGCVELILFHSSSPPCCFFHCSI